ncbi:MAG: XRE family transcriptional regulator [Candidatus Melainabacteria bacterium]|nr:XRE family transcriptional regulator [Candidatus Melainabacteria bacterium]
MKKHDYEISSGNIFKDLGFGDEEAVNLLARTDLIIEIKRIVKENRWSQAEAAKILKISQPRVSELMTTRIEKFSLDILLKFLARLGKHVSFVVQDAPKVA